MDSEEKEIIQRGLNALRRIENREKECAMVMERERMRRMRQKIGMLREAYFTLMRLPAKRIEELQRIAVSVNYEAREGRRKFYVSESVYPIFVYKESKEHSAIVNAMK